MPLYTHKIIAFLLLLALCVNFCACSTPSDITNTSSDTEVILDTWEPGGGLYLFSYTVAFEFSDLADVEAIEKRITAFKYHIESKEVNGNKVAYVLKRNRVAEDGFFDLLCTNDAVSIENTEGKVLLTREDVSNIQFEWKHTIVTVSAYRYTELVESACCFVRKDKSVPISTFAYGQADEENVVRFTPFRLLSDLSDENYVIYLKGAINLMSPPLNGKVSAEVLASK